MLIHVLNRTAKQLCWWVVLGSLSACMIQSGAQQITMQPAAGAFAWAYAFVGADGTRTHAYTGLQPQTRYLVSLSARVQMGMMRFAIMDTNQRPVVQLVVAAGDVVTTQATMTSDKYGQIVVIETMMDARNGEYQVWMRPATTP